MGIDVQYLVDEWERLHTLMRPSPRLFPEPTYFFDRDLAEISLMTSRREYWEVYVCLMGYSEQSGDDPYQILWTIPFWELFSRGIEQTWEQIPFVRYCAEFKTVLKETFLPVAYTLALVGPIGNTPEKVECFQICYRKHNDNWQEVWRCYDEEQSIRVDC